MRTYVLLWPPLFVAPEALLWCQRGHSIIHTRESWSGIGNALSLCGLYMIQACKQITRWMWLWLVGFPWTLNIMSPGAGEPCVRGHINIPGSSCENIRQSTSIVFVDLAQQQLSKYTAWLSSYLDHSESYSGYDVPAVHGKQTWRCTSIIPRRVAVYISTIHRTKPSDI